MTATESHRKALRARWRPDLRGLRSLRGTRSGSASPGRNSLGLYWLSGRCLLLYWLPWYRVSPAYLGGVLRCPPPRPAGGESCGCGRSGRLITPQLTQCGVGCCRDSARNRHTRGRLPPATVHINTVHCHSPPAEPPTRVHHERHRSQHTRCLRSTRALSSLGRAPRQSAEGGCSEPVLPANIRRRNRS